MNGSYNLLWFKDTMVNNLVDYEIKYKYFEEGDFGSLDQVEFNSPIMGGEIDFWSSGWLGIQLVDYVKGEQLINIFLGPAQEIEKDKAVEELIGILKQMHTK